MAAPLFEIMAGEPRLESRMLPSHTRSNSASSATQQSLSPASHLSSTSARPPLRGSAKISSEPSPRSSFGEGNPLLAAATAAAAAAGSSEGPSTSYRVRLARAAAAKRSTPSSSQSGIMGDNQDSRDDGFMLYDDEEEDEDSEEGEESKYVGDVSGPGAVPRSGGIRDRDGSLSHRAHHRTGRRRRGGGIPLDEQRAAPPAPISTSTFSLPSTNVPHMLGGISHSSSSTSTGPNLSNGMSSGHQNLAASGQAYPLPETSNTLRKSERRTQVRRTHKLAYMLGGEVLVDGDRLDRATSPPLQRNERGKGQYTGGSSSAFDAGDQPPLGNRRGSDSMAADFSPAWVGVGAPAAISGSRAVSTALNPRSTSMYVGHSSDHDGMVRTPIKGDHQGRLSPPKHPGPFGSGSSSTGLSGKVAELDHALASVLRRRSRSVLNSGARLSEAQPGGGLHEDKSPALTSIQGHDPRTTFMYDNRDLQHAQSGRASGSHRLAMRRSLESIRTTMTTSTFAESTMSSFDEAALERRAEAQQREERRRKVAKMTRWLGVVVPPELVTSPGAGPPTPQAHRTRTEDFDSAQHRMDWMSPGGISHLSPGAGIGAALYGKSSDEVKNKMARVAGKFMKLGGPGLPGQFQTGSNSAAGSSAGLTVDGVGSGIPPSGANLAALDLSGASSSSAAYKQLKPLDLNLSGSLLHRTRMGSSGSRDGTDANRHTADEDSLLTPMDNTNALSPRERIANVKRANKLERVFGEAPPHMLFSVGGSAGTNPRGALLQSSSAPVTPRSSGPRLGDGSITSMHAALGDLVVSLPSSSFNASALHQHPYGPSIPSSPRSFRSAYRQSLDSLEYLLENDVPLLHEMMTALDEDDGSSTPPNTTPVATRPSVDNSTGTAALTSPLPAQHQRPPTATPKSPDTPGHRRYHSMTSPVYSGLERMAIFDPSDILDAQSPKAQATVSSSSVDSGIHPGLERRRSERAEDLSQMSPLQLAPWDLLDALAPSAHRPAFGVDGDRSARNESRGSFARSSHDQAMTAGTAVESGYSSPNSARASGPLAALSPSRRASLVSHLSRLSSTPSLSTLNSISPPGSPRDAISAEHELRRQRALRAQKLGRFFGAAPNTMPCASAAVGSTGAEASGGARSLDEQNGASTDSGEASAASTSSGFGLENTVILPPAALDSSSSAISTAANANPSGLRVRRLAPRSAGSAMPHNSFMRMLRSLEEEAMEDEALTAAERKEIRDRLNAMRRRGEDGASSLLVEEMSVL
ncbi:hypothetical protein A4X09_0g486 [Tilletia walkeri]|uniref:Uncharacterized protein n=1 Tax=Tilletia walkeri TaxID=117179 RepID=A0A8X7NGK2_9BASI|nr:hypothetical protein A4X09_0g486 [Tilletia walkeri]